MADHTVYTTEVFSLLPILITSAFPPESLSVTIHYTIHYIVTFELMRLKSLKWDCLGEIAQKQDVYVNHKIFHLLGKLPSWQL